MSLSIKSLLISYQGSSLGIFQCSGRVQLITDQFSSGYWLQGCCWGLGEFLNSEVVIEETLVEKQLRQIKELKEQLQAQEEELKLTAERAKKAEK